LRGRRSASTRVYRAILAQFRKNQTGPPDFPVMAVKLGALQNLRKPLQAGEPF
jgi:hypothetical protein